MTDERLNEIVLGIHTMRISVANSVGDDPDLGLIGELLQALKVERLCSSEKQIVIEQSAKRIAELEARLDAVQNCPAHETTGCDSSGETFAVVYLLKDDVLKALGGDDG